MTTITGQGKFSHVSNKTNIQVKSAKISQKMTFNKY